MLRRVAILSLVLWSGLFLTPRTARAQAPPSAPAPISIQQLEAGKERVWAIFGRVTAPDGEPVGGAHVEIDLGAPVIPLINLETNLKGEFRTEAGLDAQSHPKLAVKVVVSKEGYSVAQESAEFKAAEGTREINLVLQPDAGDSDLLSMGALIEGLAGGFREPESGGPLAAAKKDYARGVERLLDNHESAGAVGPLRSAVDLEPDCLACRTLLTLALLDTGRWETANQHLAEAVKLTTSGKAGAARSEAFLILGVLETWRHDFERALGFLMKALEFQPSDPLVLQETGRTLILQGNWGAADEYLEKAIAAGASPNARLLRIRALLELGDNAEAEAEMKAYLGNRRPMDLPFEGRMVYARLKERLELKAYEQVRSVVERSTEELVGSMPELEGLEPSTGQKELAAVLARVRSNVETFFQQMPNTISLEEIHEESLNLEGEVKASLDERFQYLLLARKERSHLGLQEYRTSADLNGVHAGTLKAGYMRTAGFACTSLHLHPAYQAKVSLRLLGRQLIDGRRSWVVAFAQRPENALVMARFDAEGKSSPVLVQGVAWIDPESYQILSMRTDLLKSPPNTRLSKQTTVIHYGEVRFKEVSSDFWLPTEVTVTVQWKGKMFRNRHRYSEYRMFNVETEEKRRSAARPIVSPNHLNQ